MSTWQDWSKVAAPELEKLTDAGRIPCHLRSVERHSKTYQDYIVDVSSCELMQIVLD